MAPPSPGSDTAPTIADLPAQVPVFPLTGVLLLPGGHLPLHVFEPRYLAMVDAALAGHRSIGIVQPGQFGPSGTSVDDATPLQSVGCCGRITSFQETGDGRLHIGLHGVCRFRIDRELPQTEPFRSVVADYADFADDLGERPALVDRPRLLAALTAYTTATGIDVDWQALEHATDDQLITTWSMVLPFDPADKQALLECPDPTHRAKLLIGLSEAAGDNAFRNSTAH